MFSLTPILAFANFETGVCLFAAVVCKWQGRKTELQTILKSKTAATQQ